MKLGKIFYYAKKSKKSRRKIVVKETDNLPVNRPNG